jgi:pimeloyl-ACP methyl ester carboxylesterase
VWDAFALEFRNACHVMCLDQRGHGESGWSQELRYSIDDHFSDISGFVEILGLDPVILMGHSMGGRNALLYAACFPEKIERLILVDSRPTDSEESSKALMQLLMHLPLEAGTLEEVVEAVRDVYPRLSPEVARQIGGYGYRRTENGKYVPKYDTRMGLECERSGYSAESLWSFVKNLSCPTLIVRGENSPFLTREDARRIVELLPRGIFREIRQTTHLPAQENPAEFAEVVWDFLNSEF